MICLMCLETVENLTEHVKECQLTPYVYPSVEHIRGIIPYFVKIPSDCSIQYNTFPTYPTYPQRVLNLKHLCYVCTTGVHQQMINHFDFAQYPVYNQQTISQFSPMSMLCCQKCGDCMRLIIPQCHVYPLEPTAQLKYNRNIRYIVWQLRHTYISKLSPS